MAPLVITVLAFLHVLFAMGWMGGLILNISAITPGIRAMSPSALLEFAAKTAPRLARFFLIAGTMTLVFGVALLGSLTLAPNSANSVIAGALLGILAYVVGVVVGLRSFMKAGRLAKAALASGQSTPTPELGAALRRGGMASAVVVLLLVLAVASMVAAGFPF